MPVTIWMTADKAKAIGCTHRARMFGLIPGFFSPSEGLWVSRSDFLNPLESLLGMMWAITRQMRGEEPDFMFAVGAEL